MIQVDPRQGSAELTPLIKAYGSNKGVTARTWGTNLPADFRFRGNGPHGEVWVGVELKKVRDLLNAMRTGRYEGHQAPEIVTNHSYSWLFLQGIWRGNPENGLLEEAKPGKWVPVATGRTRYMHAELGNFLNSLQVRTPIKVTQCDTVHEAALALINLYKWWQKKWTEHKSFKVIYTAPSPLVPLSGDHSLVRRWANQIYGLGWEKSEAVDTYFKTPLDMVVATEADWRRLPGVDKVLARRIVRAIHHGEPDRPKRNVLKGV